MVMVIGRAARAHKFALANGVFWEVKLLGVDLARSGSLLLCSVLIAVFRLERWVIEKGLGCIPARLFLTLKPRHFTFCHVARGAALTTAAIDRHQHLN